MKFIEWLKENLKYIMIISLVFILVSFIISQTLASPNLEIIDVEKDNDKFSVVYSDNSLHSNLSKETIVRENVKDSINYDSDEYLIYLTTDNKLYIIDYDNKDYINAENDYLILENVRSINHIDHLEQLEILTTDNILYNLNKADYINEHFELVKDILEDSYPKLKLNKIAENVKNNNYHHMFIGTDNNLYAYAENFYGQKINNGEYLSKPTKILDNIVEYNDRYALDNLGNLYTYSEELVYPTLLQTNIVSFEHIYYYENNLFFTATTTDNKEYIYDYYLTNEAILKDSKLFTEAISDDVYMNSYWGVNRTIIRNNTLYYVSNVYDGINIIKIMDNVKQALYIGNYELYILGTDDTLYYYKIEHEWIENPYVKKVLHLEYVEDNKFYKLMENVKEIIKDDHIYSNLYFIMNDNTIFNNDFNLVTGVPNTGEIIPITSFDLVTFDKTKFTVGDKPEYFANIFPFNATNKKVSWTSSNPKVATVDEKGTITTLAPGTTTITVETADGKFTESQDISVYPQVAGVEITNGDTLDLGIYEKVILTANITPSDTIDNELIWTANTNEGIHLSQSYYDEEKDEYLPIPSNQAEVYVGQGGTYTVTVTTKNGLYSDTITINTVEKVNHIELEFEEGHYDGSYNAFIYLNENNKLEVGYKVYPISATNQNVIWDSSNKEVATVTNTGVITAKKAGFTKITVKSEDNGAERTFNLLVYDYNSNTNIIGDVTGDDEVNILDVIKLRRYLAGLEELN